MLHILFTTLTFALLWPISLAHPQPTPTDLPTSIVSDPPLTPTLNEADRNKYFHEPGGHEPGEDDRLGHYDTRYFHGLVSLDERTETLTHMVRAYLTIFQKLGLETWIAHGTLLGWWWNGKVSKQNMIYENCGLSKHRFYHGTGTSIPKSRAQPSSTWRKITIGQPTNIHRKTKSAIVHIS
jgi:hypothetical protein